MRITIIIFVLLAFQNSSNVFAIETPSSPTESILNEELIRSLRDPFLIPSSVLSKIEKQRSELENFPLSDLKLNGVITGPKRTRAMITGPNGKSYFISPGEPIGVRDGRVTQINADSVRIVEYESNDRGKKIPEVLELRLSGELVSLSKKENE